MTRYTLPMCLVNVPLYNVLLNLLKET